MWKRSAVIVPGAQKSGTTTLFKMLAQHSRVDRPALKEPQFFSLDQEEIEKNLSWYKGLFSKGDGTVLLDASTHYLVSATAPAAIKKYIAEPRIVIILRDPVQRAYSSYLHMHTKQSPADRRRFESILAAVEDAAKGRSVRQAEDETLRRAVARGAVDARYMDEGYHRRFHGEVGAAIRTAVEDPLFIYKYFQLSLYREQVPAYAQTFGAENVHVTFFERLLADPEGVMRGVLDFLGLAPEEEALELVHGNKTRPPRNKVKQRLLAFRQSSAVMEALIAGLNSAGLGPLVRSAERFVRKPPPKPRLSRSQYERARALLAGEYAYWQARHEDLHQLWRYPDE